jgi:hypothetical protein
MMKAVSLNLPVVSPGTGYWGQARKPQLKSPSLPVGQDRFVHFSSSQQAGDKPDYQTIARNTQVTQQGYSISGRITFEVATDKPLRADDAIQVQILLGYHPAGYDFMNFRSTPQEDGKHLNTWKCSASCD